MEMEQELMALRQEAVAGAGGPMQGGMRREA